MIKSFRGKLDDGGYTTIRLSTNDGMTGYLIKKFELLPYEPGKLTQELIGKIFSTPREDFGPTFTASAEVDFDDPTLLACSVYAQSADSYNTFHTVVFDNVTINQDIYITLQDTQNAGGSNYYIELEQIKLDLNEATVATLKDLRGSE